MSKRASLPTAEALTEQHVSEGLQILVAFREIDEPVLRRVAVALVETLADIAKHSTA